MLSLLAEYPSLYTDLEEATLGIEPMVMCYKIVWNTSVKAVCRTTSGTQVWQLHLKNFKNETIHISATNK